MKRFPLWLFCWQFALFAAAQTNLVEKTPWDTCTHFVQLLQQADSLFELGDYEMAFYKYSAAKSCKPDLQTQADAKIQLIFDQAIQLRDIAAQNRDTAYMQSRRDEKIRGYFEFSEGRAWAYSPMHLRFALIDEVGLQLTDFQYSNPQRFYNGIAVAKENNQLVALDRSGRQQGEPFEEFLPAENGYIVYRNKTWTFVDKKFAALGNETFDELRDQRHCFWAKKEDKWGLIDRYGERRTAIQYEWVSNFSEGKANAKLDAKWVVLDTLGKEINILKQEYDYLGTWAEGKAKVKRDGKWGFINTNGLELAAPAYEDVSLFSEGRAAVKINGKWGYIDSIGNLVVEAQYLKAGDFHQGIAAVALSFNGWGCINKEGETVIDFKYSQLSDLHDGKIVGTLGDKYGWLDTLGRWTALPNVDFLGDFYQDKAPAKSEDKWGVISPSGKWIVEPKLLNIGVLANGAAAFADENNKVGLMDGQGKVMVSPRFFIAVNGLPMPIQLLNSESELLPYQLENDAVRLPFYGSYFYIKTNGKVLQPKIEAKGKI